MAAQTTFPLQTTCSAHSWSSSSQLSLGNLCEAPEKKARDQAKKVFSFIKDHFKSQRFVMDGKWEFTKKNSGEGMQKCPFPECKQSLFKEYFQIKNLATGEELNLDIRVQHIFDKGHRFPKGTAMGHGVLALKEDYQRFVCNVATFMSK